MADKKLNKLLKEFPFLEEMEKKFGELGSIRVRKISPDELEMLRDFINGGMKNMKFDYEDIVEPSPNNNGEGILFLRQSTAKTEFTPEINLSTVFKYEIREELKMKTEPIRDLYINTVDGNDMWDERIDYDVFGKRYDYNFRGVLKEYLDVESKKVKSVEEKKFIEEVQDFHPEVMCKDFEKLLKYFIADECKDALLFEEVIVLKNGMVFNGSPEEVIDGVVKFSLHEGGKGTLEIQIADIVGIMMVRNQLCGWNRHFEIEYRQNLAKCLGLPREYVNNENNLVVSFFFECMQQVATNSLIGEKILLNDLPISLNEKYSELSVKVAMGTDSHLYVLGLQVIITGMVDNFEEKIVVVSWVPMLNTINTYYDPNKISNIDKMLTLVKSTLMRKLAG